MFDEKAFAESMVKQGKELIPAEFSIKEKQYIHKTMENFVLLAGEALNNDKELNFTDEQKVYITQIIAEWTFHKSVDLIRGNIPQKFWDSITQKIAFTIFEVAKQGLLRELDNEQILKAIEHHVVKCHKKCIEELFANDKITEEIKNIAIEQSNIDVMKERAGFQTPEIVEKKESCWQLLFNFLKEFIIDYLKIFFALMSVIFVLTLFCKYKNLLLNINMWQIIFVIALIVLCIIACIYFAGKAEIKYQEKELADLKQEMQDLVNPEKMYDRLGVDVVSVPVGQGLLCIADPDQEGSLLAKIAALRQKMTDNYGYIIPSVRVFDSSELKENEYCISIRNNVVDTGFVYPGKYMVIADQYEAKFDKIPEDAVDAEDPAYKTKVYWLNRSDAKEATSKDVTAVDAEDVIITHLSETLINQVEYVLTDNDIKKLFKLLEDDKFEESLLKKISYSDIKNVLVNLIKEKVSVRDITFIFSKLEDYSRFSKEPDILSERIRKDLSRQLSLTNCNRDKIIHAIEILPELTKKLVEKVQPQKGYTKTKLEIDFEEYKDLVETIAEKLMKNHQKIGSQPVIFCDEKLRLGLYRLLVKHIPTIVVLAPNEIVNDVKVEIVDTVV